MQAEHGGRIRMLPGIEVDILADGSLDLEDSTLAEMDIVIASVHSHFNQPMEEMTARVLRAMENPHVRILGHPTGRKVLSREPYAIDMEQVLQRAAELGVAVEHNASPARADLCDLHLRRAKELGCKIVVNTDAHSTEELDLMRFGITQLRRAWLTAADVLNTAPTAEPAAASSGPSRAEYAARAEVSRAQNESLRSGLEAVRWTTKGRVAGPNSMCRRRSCAGATGSERDPDITSLEDIDMASTFCKTVFCLAASVALCGAPAPGAGADWRARQPGRPERQWQHQHRQCDL